MRTTSDGDRLAEARLSPWQSFEKPTVAIVSRRLGLRLGGPLRNLARNLSTLSVCQVDYSHWLQCACQTFFTKYGLELSTSLGKARHVHLAIMKCCLFRHLPLPHLCIYPCKTTTKSVKHICLANK